MKNNFKIVTHNGNFHADDVFAVATLELWLEKNDSGSFFNKKIDFEIIRTRNPEMIAQGDFVIDVGGEYDPIKKKFDHHQIGGGGKRSNGILYSSFGLVWKEYGEKICGSADIANLIDKKLAQPIDAEDNGVDLYRIIYSEIKPYAIGDLIDIYNFLSKQEEKENLDGNFLQAVAVAKNIVKREIEIAKKELVERQYVEQIYQMAENKKIIILDKEIGDKSWEMVLSNYPNTLYIVRPDGSSQNWKVKAVRNSLLSFENRKRLPSVWAGKADEELVQITGVPDAVFCHNQGFVAVAKTKEGALELARLAVEA